MQMRHKRTSNKQCPQNQRFARSDQPVHWLDLCSMPEFHTSVWPINVTWLVWSVCRSGHFSSIPPRRHEPQNLGYMAYTIYPQGVRNRHYHVKCQVTLTQTNDIKSPQSGCSLRLYVLLVFIPQQHNRSLPSYARSYRRLYREGRGVTAMMVNRPNL